MFRFDLARRLAFAGLALTAAPLLGADYTSTWINGSDLWSSLANWDTPSAPGTLPKNGAFTYDAILSNGSSITLDQDIAIQKFTLSSGTINGGFNLTANDLLTWTGGAMSSSGVTNANGGLSLAGAVKVLSERTLNNAGAANWTAGDLYSGSGAVFNNLAGATFTTDFDGGFHYNLGGAQSAFNNAGTLTKSGGTGSTYFSTTFSNTGVVNVQTGNLTLANGDGGATTGAFNVSNVASLNFGGGTFTLGAAASITGAGTVFFSGGSTTVNGSYNITGASSFTGANVTFDAPVTSLGAGPLTMTNGAVYFNAATPALGGIDLSGGTLGGTGTVTATGSVAWTGGAMSGSGITNANGGLSLAGTTRYFTERMLNNAGAAVWTAGELYSGSGAVFNNLAGATFNTNFDGGFHYNLGGAQSAFNNAGTLTKSGGTGTTYFSTTFNNAGTVNIQTGTLALAGGDGGTTTGDFNISSGATLRFLNNFDLAATADITGAGTAQFSGGTVSLLSSTVSNILIDGGTVSFNSTTSAASVVLSGGALGGTGTLTATGPLTWNGGTMNGSGITNANGGLGLAGTTRYFTERTLNNAGAATWTAGDIYSGSGAVFNNQFGATFDTNSDGGFHYNLGGALSVFNNAGTLTKSGGSGTTYFGTAFNNTGTVSVQTGTLTLGNGDGGTTTGDFTIASGATLRFIGNFELTATADITGAGTAQFSSGTVNLLSSTVSNILVNGGTANFNGATGAAHVVLSGGALGGSGMLNVGSLTWTGGTMNGSGMTSVTGITTLSSGNQKFLGRMLTNRGTMTYSSSDGSTPIYFGPDPSAPGVLTNNGTFNVTAGGDFTHYYNPGGQAINNAGVWNVSGPGTTSYVAGVVAFNNTGTVNVLSGAFALGGGDAGSTTGAFHVANGAVLNLYGGTFALDAASSVTGAGAMVFSGGNTTVNGTYNITGASYFTGGTVTFTAPVTSLGAGPLGISNGAVYFNSSTPAVGGIALSGGTLGGMGTVTSTGSLAWTGGVMAGSGTTSVAGLGSTISSGVQKWLGRVLANTGTMTYSSSDTATPIYFGPDPSAPGVLNNNGIFNVTAGGDFAHYYNPGGQAINNAGIWNVSGPGATSYVSGVVAFNNTGTVNVLSGGLALGGGDSGSTTGAFHVSSGAVLNFYGGSFMLGAASSITGAGALFFSGGTAAIDGTYNITGASAFTGANVTFNAPVTSLGAGPLTISNGAAYFNSTTSAVGGINFSGGTLGGTGTVVATGRLAWTGGTMTGSGTTSVAGLTSTLSGSNQKWLGRVLTNSGTMTYSSSDGSTPIYFAPDPASPGVLNNNGTFKVTAGGDFAQYYNPGGQAINNAGIWNVSGPGTTSYVSGNIAFNNTGTVKVLSGAFAVGGGDSGSTTGAFQVSNGATLNLSGGTYTLGAASSITGAGTTIFSGGSTTINGTYNITGSSYFTGATVTFNAPVAGLGAGPLSISSGAVYFNSTTPAVGGIELSGGTLGGAGLVTATDDLTWSGGVMSGSGTTSVAGLDSTISSDTQKWLGRVLANSGTMTYDSSDGSTPIYFGADPSSPGVLNNNGTFNVTAGGDFTHYYNPGGQAVNNAGIWNVSGPGTTSYVGGVVAFNNTGTVNVLSGGFAVGGGDSGSTPGAFHVASGAVLNFSGGTFTLDAAASITGAGALIFSGGTTMVSGTYNITGTSSFTGGTATFDSPVTSLGAGPLSVSGGAVYFNSTTPAVGGIDLSGGTLGGSGTVTATDDLAWTGGVMTGNGTTSVTSLASTISGNAQKWLGRVLTNSGTITFSTSDNTTPFYFGPDPSSPGVLNNNGTFNVTAGGDFAQYYAPAGQAINNAGIWNVSGPGTVSNVTGTIAFNNTGTIHVQQGVLALDGGLQGAGGTVQVDLGAMLTLGGTSTFTGANGVNSGVLFVNGSLNATTGNFATNGGMDGGGGGLMELFGSSTAGGGTYATQAGDDLAGANGGRTNFRDSASADHATFIAHGYAGPTTGDGGRTTFWANSTAGSSILTANGGTGGGAGGLILFLDDSTGGLTRVQVFGNGQLDISGHNSPGVSIGSLTGTGNVFLGANNLSVGANVLSTVFSGVLQDGGFNGGIGSTLTKTGAATLTLAGANSYTGATRVAEGTLLINGNQSAATGSVTVDPLATLGGSGVIGGAVSLAGNLAPGNSPGLLTFSSNLTLAGTAITVMELGGLGRGTAYDAANVTGLLTLAGRLQVQMVNNFVPQVGDTFTVLNYGSRTGFFGAYGGIRIAPTLALQPTYTAGSLLLTVEARDPAAGDFDAVWSAPVNGVWDEAPKWDSNPFFPNNGESSFDATLGVTGSPYTVSLGTDISIKNLNLSSPDGLLAHTAGILQLSGAINLQAGTYSLQGGVIKGATINQAGGALVFTNNSGNRLDGTTMIGDLNLNTAGGSWVRLQNGATFTGNAHISAPAGGQAVLTYEQSSTLSGATVNMDGLDGTNYLTIEGTSMLTVGPSGKIRGRGLVGFQSFANGASALLNQGTISSDINGLALTLTGTLGSFTNTGLAEAVNGATLNIQAASFANLGVFKVASGGTIEIYNATVAGLGTLTNLGGTINLRGDMDNEGGVHTFTVTNGPVTLNGGRFFGGGTINVPVGLRIGNNGSNRLDGVTFNGALNLNETGGAWVRLQNGAAFTGNASLGSPDGSISVLAFEQTGVLDGVTVNMGGLAANTYLTIEGINTLTVGPAAVIRGQGVIGNQAQIGGPNALLNQGRISADLNGRTLSVQPTTFTNAGVLEAKNEAVLSVPNSYTQTAGVTRLNNGTINSPVIYLVAGILEGHGTVNANVTSSGIVNFDASGILNGTLDVTGGKWDGLGVVTGLVTVSSGVFTMGSGANLKADGNLAVTGGGTIAADDATGTITGNVNYAAASASNFGGIIAGAGKTLTVNNAAATLTLAGPGTYTGATTVMAGILKAGVASVANVSGAFGNNSAVTVADSADAILDITGFNTQIGSLTGGGSSGGNVFLGGATLSVGGNRSNTAPYAGTISGGGGVTKIGAGTQILRGLNTYAGTTTINGGTLLLDFASLATPTGLLSNASGLTLGGGTLRVLGQTGAGVIATQTMGELTLTANTAGTIFLDPNNSGSGSTTLTLGNTWTRLPGSSLVIDYTSPNSGDRIVRTTGPVTGSGALSHGIFQYALVKDSGGIGFASQDGSFNIVRSTAASTVLAMSNSVAGTTTTHFSTVSTDPDYAAVGGTLTLDNVAHASSTLSIDSTGGGTLDLGGVAGVLTLTSNAVLMQGDDDYAIQNGALGASGSEVIIHQTGTGLLTVSSPVSGGAGSLTKDGSGPLTLTGPQDYATLTTNAGTTNLSAALGTGTSTLNANATTNIYVTQTLAALNVGDGAEVTFGDPADAFAAPGGKTPPLAGFAAGLSIPGAVPEPSTGGLLGLGVLLLGWRRKGRPAAV